MMNGLRIDAEPDAPRAAELFEVIEKELCHDSFSVITDDHRRHVGQLAFDGGEKALGGFCIQIGAGFSIHANDLLLLRNDPGLDASGPFRLDQEFRTFDLLLVQEASQIPSWIIICDSAEELGRHIEGSEIPRHVRSSARHEIFPRKLDDWNWSFRRNSRHVTPNKMIEHDIAHDSDR